MIGMDVRKMDRACSLPAGTGRRNPPPQPAAGN